jgi:outer membrane lipoprotein SlyB
MNRRRFLAASATATALSLAGCAARETSPDPVEFELTQ